MGTHKRPMPDSQPPLHREKAAEFLASLDCEFRPEIRQDCGAVNWRGMPLLCHDLDGLEDEDEQTCPYCGKINLASARACGEGEWDGCGAALPRQEEPPQGMLLFSNATMEPYHDGCFAPPSPDSYFYPGRFTGVTLAEWKNAHRARRTFEDFRLELGKRLLSAFQKAIKGALSPC